MSINLVHRKIPFSRNLEQIFASFFLNSENSFWLDSSRVDGSFSRFSFMGQSSENGNSIVQYSNSTGKVNLFNKSKLRTELDEDIFDCLQRSLKESSCTEFTINNDIPFDFIGGYVGYFGYGLMSLTEEVYSRHASANTPDAYFMYIDKFIAYDHKYNYLYVIALLDGNIDENSANLWINEMISNILLLCNTEYSSNSDINSGTKNFMNATALMPKYLLDTKDSYLSKIAACKEKIVDGESYEVCLTTKIEIKLEQELNRKEIFNIYTDLRRVNPAPYSGIFLTPDFSILCSSPERFLSVDANGIVQARPIKGTTPRFSSEKEDLESKNRLKDKKYFSENIMIVDLLRNDLAKVCAPGTVKVPNLMHIESYASVHQLITTIEGTLERPPIECIRSCFPGGSMTGAPKKRTLEIIDLIESAARGIYSGSLGFLSLNSTMDFNIIIRSIIIDKTNVEIGVGGAITQMSDPVEEYEEILLKARLPFKVLIERLQLY